MAPPAARSDLARLPITIDLSALSLEEGVRAGLAVAVLVAANAILHRPMLLESGLGALLTCLCDVGGPIRRRIPALLAFGGIGAAILVSFGLLRPIGYPLIPLAVAGVFCCGFARIYGLAALQVGNLLSVVLVLALDARFGSVGAALRFAGAFAVGAAWALVLTMAIWRLHPNRPARQALARVYLALGAMAEDVRRLIEAEAVDPAGWERHARAHRRAVRDAIEAARTAIADRLGASFGRAHPMAQTLLRLEIAEQIFGAAIALTDVLETTPDRATRAAGRDLAERLAFVTRSFAPHIVAESDRGLAAVGAAVAALASLGRSWPAEARLRPIAEMLAELLRGAMNLTNLGQTRPGAAPPRGAWLDGVLAPLRANLTWQSLPLRHAARVAVVATVGFVITFTWPTSYQHWLTITLILTLQPYYAGTLQRALERIGGTVAGGLLAACLSLVCHTPIAIAAALFPLSVLALALRGVNFALYCAALTPMVVLLVELARPGQGHVAIVAMRALYTLIGGGLAVLGTVFLWPSWEPARLETMLRDAVRRHMRYGRATLALLGGHGGAAEAEAARRAAGLACNNLEAALSRALTEPGLARAEAGRLEAAVAIDAALRRLGGRLAALQIDPAARGTPPEAWRDWLEKAGEALDATPVLPLDPAPEQIAPGALGEALERIGRQLALIGGALRRGEEGRLFFF